jgi:SAM-dependent methyltransferase
MKRFDRGIRLDIGCGDNKQPNWVGMDKRKVKGVDIVHDAQDFPYPLESDSCFQVLLSHLWEHIEPKHRIDLMNEIWRILKMDGQLLISVPYYLSFGACQDPTHYTCPTEATFTYFDPNCELYKIYKPKPWKLVQNNYSMNGNMEVILEKIKG